MFQRAGSSQLGYESMTSSVNQRRSSNADSVSSVTWERGDCRGFCAAKVLLVARTMTR
ncbi:hypothetical protein RAB80_002199 [Fusarium oxysporum f. sp. vasinfectum]|nr:hypothetical protein RAB80_010209 [Fusarium oxysporum f. sp. vasinfectum]KAK2680406.1 hypothetical protein RAB80_002199 [Fusarium oxysporum f. sp. vasinfectum]